MYFNHFTLVKVTSRQAWIVTGYISFYLSKKTLLKSFYLDILLG